MPNYVYQCPHKGCSYAKEVTHSFSECDLPSPATLAEIECPNHRTVMKRVPQVPFVIGITGKSEKQLVQEKGDLVRKRAKAHTANEGYKDIKDPDIRANIEKKRAAGHYNDVKGTDHEKIKI
jgi:hypothetical protein